MTKPVCDLCRRVIETWRKPVVFANRIFCNSTCEADHKFIQEQLYGIPKVEEPPPLKHLQSG